MTIKVLHVFTVPFSITYFVGKQFEYLQKKSGSQFFVACSDPMQLTAMENEYNFTAIPIDISRNINPLKDLKSIYQLYRFIKKNEINTVVGHSPKGGMVAMISAYLSGISNRIYFRHGIFYETSKGIKQFIFKNVDRISGTLATKVVCVSNAVAERSVIDNLNKSSKNFLLGKGTCNGVDTLHRFNRENYSLAQILNLRQKYSIKDNDRVVGFVGRLVHDKGIDELIQAWQIIKQKNQNVKLILVGPLEERDSLLEETKKTILEDATIIFTDYCKDAAPLYNLMDIFILPTYREGFPTVVLEASAMELPIVITKATGCEEAIIENETGIFIENNAESIADGIQYYLDNTIMAKEHGTNGRIFVEKNFQQEKIWDIIHDTLKY